MEIVKSISFVIFSCFLISGIHGQVQPGLSVDENHIVLFGQDTIDGGTKLIWYPHKAAFRAGKVNSSQWNPSNLGPFSTAFGSNTEARGNYSAAFGDGTWALSYGETSVGTYSLGGGDNNTWIATDPVFEVGNGTSSGDRSNALTVLKNGDVIIPDLAGNGNRNLEVDASGKLIVASSAGASGIVTDIDGNTYLTVQIGTQTWMKENLRTTRYKDGTPIAKVFDTTVWTTDDMTGKYTWYNNDILMDMPHGKLYNWWAAVDERGLCPEGWHVPSLTEAETLGDFLGGEAIAGGKMKVPNTVLWDSPNTGANNESGFTAIASGWRINELFLRQGNDAYFWTSTPAFSNFVYSINLSWNSTEMNIAPHTATIPKNRGQSVRCIQD